MIKKDIILTNTEPLKRYGLENIKLGCIKLVCFKKGEFICREGYPMEFLLIILEGTAKVNYSVANGKTLLMSFFTEGSILGEIEFMMESESATASVQAIDNVRCLGIDIHKHKEELMNNSNFLWHIGGALANKLNRCSVNSAITILHPLEVKLCSYIVMTSHDGVFQESLTELSEWLGTSYRHLLRTLKSLCNEGVLQKESGGRYIIIDAKTLREKSEEFYTI